MTKEKTPAIKPGLSLRFRVAPGTRRASDDDNIECNKILPDKLTESKPETVVALGRSS